MKNADQRIFRELSHLRNCSIANDSGLDIVPLSSRYRAALLPLSLPLSFTSQEALQALCFYRVLIVRPWLKKCPFCPPAAFSA